MMRDKDLFERAARVCYELISPFYPSQKAGGCDGGGLFAPILGQARALIERHSDSDLSKFIDRAKESRAIAMTPRERMKFCFDGPDAGAGNTNA